MHASVRRRAARAALLSTLVAITPRPAVAQQRTGAVPSIPALRPDQVVWVTTRDGREREGRLAALAPDGVRLTGTTSAGPSAWEDVALVETRVRDPLTNGVKNGAISGAVGMAGFAGFILALVCSIEGCDVSDAARFSLISAGLGAGGGAALGAVVDASRPTRAVVHPGSIATGIGDVALGETLWVTRRNGRLDRGRLLAIDDDGLRLGDGGTGLVVPIGAIATIEARRPDALGNGALLGTLYGAGGMAGVLVIGQAGGGDCCEPGLTLYWTAVGAGIGALAGAGIDALVRSRTVMPMAGSRVRARIRPLLSRDGAGVHAALSW